jgi:death-on-curing protein
VTTPLDPVFLDLDDVLLIHEEQLAKYGGGAGIRDAGLLDSALGTPRATFGGDFVHEDLFAMAAAYAFHIAQNQPFVDGNKRTGLLAALVFLDLNGIVVTDPEGRLYDAMVALAERRLDKGGVAGLLRELAQDAPPAGDS